MWTKIELPPPSFWIAALSTSDVGRIARCLLAMGCSVGVVTDVLPSINPGHREGEWGNPYNKLTKMILSNLRACVDAFPIMSFRAPIIAFTDSERIRHILKL